MKALVCEMCKGNDLIKKDGLYVCQHCGTKYSTEEAQKLLVEGYVKIDYSDELNKLYEVARRAKSTGNTAHAQKFYEKILEKDPSSWEANFYAVYYQSLNSKVGDICLAATRIKNIEDDALKLIKDSSANPDVWRCAVEEISESLLSLSDCLFQAAREHYYGIDVQIRFRFNQEYTNNCRAIREILYVFSDLVIDMFDDPSIKRLVIPCLEKGFEQHKYILLGFGDKRTLKYITKEHQLKLQALRESLNLHEANGRTGKKYDFEHNRSIPFTLEAIVKELKNDIRKEMKIPSIVFFGIAGLNMLLSFLTAGFLAYAIPSAILGIMFLLLGITPKNNQFLLGNKDLVKKIYLF